MKNFFVCLFVLFVLFGCTQQGNLTGSVFQGVNVSKIKSFLNDSSLQVSYSTMAASEVAVGLSGFSTECRQKLLPKDYIVVNAIGLQSEVQLFLDKETQQVVCVNKKQLEAGLCKSDADCDDGLRSTVDKCVLNSGECSNERTVAAVSGDNFCPRGFTSKQDSDCVRECIVASDCDDGDILTVDSCSVLGKCNREALVVAGKTAVLCSADTDCVSENSCEAGICSKQGICGFESLADGTLCENSRDKKNCIKGECVKALDNPVYILNNGVKWREDGSVEVFFSTNKLSSGEVKYGVNPTFSVSKKSEQTALSHSIVLNDLQIASTYYYEMIATDLAEVTISKSQLLKFFTCIGLCNDNDACTADSCDLKTGKCVNEKNPECT